MVRSDGQPASGRITADYVGSGRFPEASFGGTLKDGQFEILTLPPGRYRLRFSPIASDRRAAPPVYYPGTPTEAAATFIEVGEGEHVEGLQFTIF